MVNNIAILQFTHVFVTDFIYRIVSKSLHPCIDGVYRISNCRNEICCTILERNICF